MTDGQFRAARRRTAPASAPERPGNAPPGTARRAPAADSDSDRGAPDGALVASPASSAASLASTTATGPSGMVSVRPRLTILPGSTASSPTRPANWQTRLACLANEDYAMARPHTFPGNP